MCPGRSGELSRSAGLSCFCELLFSTLVSSDAGFVTWFRTTVETVKDTCIGAILTFYRVGSHVSLCDW